MSENYANTRMPPRALCCKAKIGTVENTVVLIFYVILLRVQSENFGLSQCLQFTSVRLPATTEVTPFLYYLLLLALESRERARRLDFVLLRYYRSYLDVQCVHNNRNLETGIETGDSRDRDASYGKDHPGLIG